MFYGPTSVINFVPSPLLTDHCTCVPLKNSFIWFLCPLEFKLLYDLCCLTNLNHINICIVCYSRVQKVFAYILEASIFIEFDFL